MSQFIEWIFIEAFRAVFVPGMRELTIPAMMLFGGYDMLLPTLAAMAGAGLGALPVWGIGRLLERVRYLKAEALPEARYQLIRRAVRRFGWLALPFFGLLPMGSLLLLIAGFFRMPWWMVCAGAATGRALVFAIQPI